MNAIQGFPFFKGATAAGESDVFRNHCYTEGTIEFKGTATSKRERGEIHNVL